MGSIRYKLELSKKAEKYLRSLDSHTRKRVNEHLIEILESPHHGPHIKALKGKYKGDYRYEISWLRIIYTVKDDILKVEVTKIGPRGDIYK